MPTNALNLQFPLSDLVLVEANRNRNKKAGGYGAPRHAVRASDSGGRDGTVCHEISCSGIFWLLCGSTSRLLVSPCPWPMAAFSYATAAHSSATSMGTSCSCPSTFACGFASTTHEQSLVHFHRLALFEECSTTNNIN